MAAHREWTERHIRELIQGELKRLKPPTGGSEGWPYCINIAEMQPNIVQGANFDLNPDMFIKKLYLIPDGENTYRAEACFAAPTSFLYQTFPNYYTVDGMRIFGLMGCNITPAGTPYWPLPVLERVDEDGNLHYLTPYNNDGSVERPYALLRLADESVMAKFSLGILGPDNAEYLKFQSKTLGSSTITPNFSIIVPRDGTAEGFMSWDLYETDYRDPLFPLGRSNYATHTICFTYRDVLAGVTSPQEGNYRTVTAVSTTGVNNSVNT